MVIKTELCTFSEWKIYPGKGVRYVAKDGRPFLYLSKRTRNFSLRYVWPYIENSKLKDSDGPPPGEDFIRKLNNPTLENKKDKKPSKSKEPSRVSLCNPSKRWKPQDLKIKRHLLRRPLDKLKKERKPPSPRNKAKERSSTRIKPPNKRPKTRLPKKHKRKQPPRKTNEWFLLCHI